MNYSIGFVFTTPSGESVGMTKDLSYDEFESYLTQAGALDCVPKVAVVFDEKEGKKVPRLVVFGADPIPMEEEQEDEENENN